MANGPRMSVAVEPSPIIVCGVARSGTTFTAALLDAHPGIAMTGEFFLYKAPAALAVFNEIKQAYAHRWTPEAWGRQRARLMRALWLAASDETQAAKSQTAHRLGNKTPGAEHYFEFYDEVFAAAPPRWVYVLREGRKVFISRKNMQWGLVPGARSQLTRYLQSLALFEAYQAQWPDRIALFQVDRIGPTMAERLAATERLLTFVGETLTPEVQHFVAAWPTLYSPEQPTPPEASSLITALTPAEQAFLDDHAEYQAAMRRYGYHV